MLLNCRKKESLGKEKRGLLPAGEKRAYLTGKGDEEKNNAHWQC